MASQSTFERGVTGVGRAAPEGLTAPERRLWQAFHSGQWLELSDGPAAEAASWGDDCTVRAETLADLLVGTDRSAAPRAAMRLAGAKITGQLDLDHVAVDVPMYFANCWFAEPPQLNAAQAPVLTLYDCQLPGTAARQLELRGDLDCRSSSVTGELLLQDASIGGLVNLGGARLTNPAGCALNADRITVTGGLFAHDNFTANGEIRIAGATLNGQLNLSRARLTSPTGNALDLGQATITGNLVASDNFTAEGEVTLTGATVNGNLELDGAHLTNPRGYALNADSITVSGSLFARDSFTAIGEVLLTSAVINGHLDLSDAHLSNPKGDAVTLSGARVSQVWMVFAAPPVGPVRLVNLQVDSLFDNPGSWPEGLWLDGLSYQTIGARKLAGDSLKPHRVDVGVAQRLEWLRRDKSGSPQPYEQLAAYYRRTGHEAEARRVLLEKHRRRRKALNLPGRLAGYVLDGLIGYGYRTWLAFVWLVGFWALGVVAFTVDRPEAVKKGEAPPYDAVMHAIDLLLPIINLGHDNVWRPTWVSAGLIVTGWVLTTAVVAGITRMLNRA